MRNAAPARERVRSWVLAANPGRDAAGLTMHTPLIRERWLTSLRITDLLLLVEELRGAPLDPRTLVPGAFRDLATIERTFLPQEPR